MNKKYAEGEEGTWGSVKTYTEEVALPPGMTDPREYDDLLFLFTFNLLVDNF